MQKTLPLLPQAIIDILAAGPPVVTLWGCLVCGSLFDIALLYEKCLNCDFPLVRVPMLVTAKPKNINRVVYAPLGKAYSAQYWLSYQAKRLRGAKKSLQGFTDSLHVAYFSKKEDCNMTE